MTSKCRICLFKTEPDSHTNIFTTAKTGQLISEVLTNFASVQIKEDDGLPAVLCAKCDEKLNMVIDFRILIISSDSQLREVEEFDENESCSMSHDASSAIKEESSGSELTENADNTEDPVAMKLPCSEDNCNKEWKKHKSKHVANKLHTCEDCGKSYKIQSNLLSHIQLNHSKTGYKCEICEDTFEQRELLQEHERNHVAEFRGQLAERLVVTVPEDTKLPMKRSHTFMKPDGPGRKKRKPCKGCYRTLRQTLSSREADKKVKRVTSYCADCDSQPGYCLQCFNQCHF